MKKNCHNIILKIEKILKTTNIDHHQYPKCHLRLRMCGSVEEVEAVEVEVGAKVVEVMHMTINSHFVFARSSCT